MSQRTVLKISGESGSLSTAGNIIVKTLRKYGFVIYSEREFPSLIKGGRANYQINFGKIDIRSLSKNIQIGIALDREGVLDCLDTLENGGILIHGFERWDRVIKDLPKRSQEKNLTVFELPAREIALSQGGSIIMVNVVLIGFLWKVLGLQIQPLMDNITDELKKKPDLLNINLNCARAGYDFVPENFTQEKALQIQDKFLHLQNIQQISSEEKEDNLLIDGNTAIALGAIHAGVRAYYAYPMSPSTSILIYLAKVAEKTGMLVKQLEDEITVAQTTLGSMHAGTRALCATSGGGLDLMTETISLAGSIETPLVIVNVQRPGPATGLPTWTAQSDLDLAIHSGHGEYAKIVLAGSDPEDCFELIQHAFNLAETYQVPTIFLTEATIAMSSATIKTFSQNQIPITRGLVKEEDLKSLESKHRYQITENGVSSRWIPGSSDTIYFANGDEHSEDGSITEEAEASEQMIAKRMRKLETIASNLPEPKIYGQNVADISIVGWGSTKNTVLDAMEILAKKGIHLNYLHYSYLWPLKTETFKKFVQDNPKVYLVEGNYQGQLGNLLKKETGFDFADKLLKYNGRPFYIEDILEFLSGK